MLTLRLLFLFYYNLDHSAQGLSDSIVDPRPFRREELLSLASQSTIKVSSLGGECAATTATRTLLALTDSDVT